MLTWPAVLGEFETMREVVAGRSLARFGDGELKIVHGSGYIREPPNQALTDELATVIRAPDPRCLIGIPTMDERGPKFAGWDRHRARFLIVLNREAQYGSAFVTRPDSAPWIECQAFGQLVRQLWEGKRVAVVCEANGSLLAPVRRGAYKLKHVQCPRHRAFSVIDRLEDAVVAYKPDIALLSAGPTATLLAHRLALRNVHAVDLGSAGKFLSRVIA